MQPGQVKTVPANANELQLNAKCKPIHCRLHAGAISRNETCNHPGRLYWQCISKFQRPEPSKLASALGPVASPNSPTSQDEATHKHRQLPPAGFPVSSSSLGPFSNRHVLKGPGFNSIIRLDESKAFLTTTTHHTFHSATPCGSLFLQQTFLEPPFLHTNIGHGPGKDTLIKGTNFK